MARGAPSIFGEGRPGIWFRPQYLALNLMFAKWCQNSHGLSPLHPHDSINQYTFSHVWCDRGTRAISRAARAPPQWANLAEQGMLVRT